MIQEQVMIADMHTHSEHSHDSVCKLDDMCRAQIARGTKVMALTDHFDTASYQAYDVYTPILKGCQEAKNCSERYRGQCEVLAGIEIGEGFWVPKVYEKVRRLYDYDVIIGSVHLVRYRQLRGAYAQIDFGKLTQEELHGYLDAYYEDIRTMLESMDIDILAHLTNPLRYIVGKYHRKVDISRYDEVIDRILETILEKGIALELNTSSLHLLGDGIPSREILERYRTKGGKLITLGSDAHVAENASVHFEQALGILREAGFRELYYYRKREPVAYPIV